jgi:hypothetical protein
LLADAAELEFCFGSSPMPRLLIERGALTIVDAQVILRDSIETQQEIMDAEWAPVNEAAAVLLSRFSEAVERQHGASAKGSEGLIEKKRGT